MGQDSAQTGHGQAARRAEGAFGNSSPGRLCPREVGVRGEDLAVAELERQGLQVLVRNWRCRWGELDIVAMEQDEGHRTLVFCEVKCRTGVGYGGPLESITHAKLRRLRQLAAQWLASEGVRADGIRLDAIGVLLASGAAPQLTHVRGIG